MSAAARLIGFAAILAVVFVVASIAGAAIDPSVNESSDEHATDTAAMAAHEAATPADAALPGLAVAQGGYRLVAERTELERGSLTTYRFRIVDAEGETVRDFELEQNRRMHLIVVRRDFTEFQHLHPRQLADGSWKVEIKLSEAGTYRAFADFMTGGQTLTLATDLFVGGPFEPAPLPAITSSSDAGDGYEVSIDSAEARVGGTTDVEFTVSRNGKPLDSVEPYLGADGHLVVLREHDQAYLHTHPDDEPGGDGPITFGVEYPSAGRYRLFLQFRDGGAVRTASFTQEVTGTDSATGEADDGHD